MERTVELILDGVKKIEMLADGKVRVLCVKEELNENKVLKNDFGDMFPYVDFENFIKNGKEIMAHEPTTEEEENLKELLVEAIEAEIENFYCTKIDPSFSEDGERIVFKVGKMPAVGKYYDWYEKAAKVFMPERNSRLGTKLQYVAFLGVLMQKLVEEKGMSVKDAWNAVCNDSKELGHYRDSKEAKHDFEPTGSREICGFCDLANAYKILSWDDKDKVFWLAGGSCVSYGDYYPLANLYNLDFRDDGNNKSVGWLVLS